MRGWEGGREEGRIWIRIWGRSKGNSAYRLAGGSMVGIDRLNVPWPVGRPEGGREGREGKGGGKGGRSSGVHHTLRPSVNSIRC